MTTTDPPAAGFTPAVTAAANRLHHALSSGIPCAPVRDLIGSDDVQRAYAVQECLTARRVAQGERIVGRKIGLTSPAVQQQLGVSQPDFGVLFSGMEYENDTVIPFDAVLQPKVEAEIAFLLCADLDTGALDLPQLRAAVEFAAPAIEICGSRISNWDISFGDTVADNASAGAFVLGPSRVGMDDLDTCAVMMTMRVDGQQDSTGSGDACLGDPLLALQWLARTARDFGQPLSAGQVVLSGALGPMRGIKPGATAIADLSGIGTVTVHFGPAGEPEMPA